MKLQRIVFFVLLPLIIAGGCRHMQTATVLDENDPSMVGSHRAGSEVYDPLVREATAQLVEDLQNQVTTVGYTEAQMQTNPGPKRICFLGVENETNEELADFREDIYQTIDSELTSSGSCICVNRRAVQSALQDLRLRPNQLFQTANRASFTTYLNDMGQPFDYLIFAVLTSGTTVDNRDSQKTYKLTCECVNVNNGHTVSKRQADIRKQYNASPKAKISNSKFNPKNWGKGK